MRARCPDSVLDTGTAGWGGGGLGCVVTTPGPARHGEGGGGWASDSPSSSTERARDRGRTAAPTLGNEIFSTLNFIIHNETPDCNDRPDTDVIVGKPSFIATKCGECEQDSLQLQNKPVCHSDAESFNY